MISRILSALLLMPAVLLLLWRGPAWVVVLLTLAITAGLIREWLRMETPPAPLFESLLPISAGWLLVATIWREGPVGLVVALLLVLLLGREVFRFGSAGGRGTGGAAFQCLGVLLAALPMGLLLDIWARPRGGDWLTYLLLVIWATDSGALFAGRRWGRTKLAPTLSPGKTWAGGIGGAIAGTLAGLGWAWMVGLPLLLPATLFLSFLMSVLGQVGDLAESMLKREAGVKDSGSLIPGHGGLWDRLDSLLFVTPFFGLCLEALRLWTF
ncbi:MAG: phosphatidate cytidylyltransferase [Magnetococcales bacterium]|nr:phosphatidate cytidylyltransferase [Magnetococcales bacterium]